MAECVNLMEQFGQKYRIIWDPARRPKEKLDPWLMVIRCKTGAEIYTFDETTLGVDLDGHRTLRKRLDGLDCCRSQGESRGDQRAARIYGANRSVPRRQLLPIADPGARDAGGLLSLSELGGGKV
jgi:hypothetical protein